MANLDLFLIVVSAGVPETPLLTIDKLTCIAHHNNIQPIMVVTKTDQNPEGAAKLTGLYNAVGIQSFSISSLTGNGVEEFKSFLLQQMPKKVACLAGVSGAGKSTLLNTLFPERNQKIGDLSQKISRGKNTTREVTLFQANTSDSQGGWIADTPGFSLLDFERFDFFSKEELPETFPEFSPYLDHCRYRNCTHTKEEGCALLEAIEQGLVPKSRHDSFLSIYQDLKNKHDWD